MDVYDQDAVELDPMVHAIDIAQRANEQAGPDEKHDRQRCLRYGEGRTKA
jgi:hypothetical protein